MTLNIGGVGGSELAGDHANLIPQFVGASDCGRAAGDLDPRHAGPESTECTEGQLFSLTEFLQQPNLDRGWLQQAGRHGVDVLRVREAEVRICAQPADWI